MLWTLRNPNLESTHGCLAIKIFSLLKNKKNIFPRTNILAKVGDVQAQCFIKQISLVVPPGKQTPGHFVWPACLPACLLTNLSGMSRSRLEGDLLTLHISYAELQGEKVKHQQRGNHRSGRQNNALRQTCPHGWHAQANDLPKLSTLGTWPTWDRTSNVN